MAQNIIRHWSPQMTGIKPDTSTHIDFYYSIRTLKYSVLCRLLHMPIPGRLGRSASWKHPSSYHTHKINPPQRHSVADALRLYHSTYCIYPYTSHNVPAAETRILSHAARAHGRRGGVVPDGLDISIRTPSNLLGEPDKVWQIRSERPSVAKHQPQQLLPWCLAQARPFWH